MPSRTRGAIGTLACHAGGGARRRLASAGRPHCCQRPVRSRMHSRSSTPRLGGGAGAPRRAAHPGDERSPRERVRPSPRWREPVQRCGSRRPPSWRSAGGRPAAIPSVSETAAKEWADLEARLLAERDRMASCHPAARRPPAFRTGVRAAGINGYDPLRADCRSGRPPAIELTGRRRSIHARPVGQATARAAARAGFSTRLTRGASAATMRQSAPAAKAYLRTPQHYDIGG